MSEPTPQDGETIAVVLEEDLKFDIDLDIENFVRQRISGKFDFTNEMYSILLAEEDEFAIIATNLHMLRKQSAYSKLAHCVEKYCPILESAPDCEVQLIGLTQAIANIHVNGNFTGALTEVVRAKDTFKGKTSVEQMDECEVSLEHVARE